jgi:hypothetical protein
LNVALAVLRRRDDSHFHHGKTQCEGHAYSFPRVHAHGTTRSLKPTQFCGQLMASFRNVLKHELAGRIGLSASVGPGSKRQENSRQGRTSLVVD